MALILLDGMEDNSSFTSGPNNRVPGRSGNCVQFISAAAFILYTIPTVSESDTVTVGVALKIPGAIGTGVLFKFMGDGFSVTHTTVQINADGSLDARRSSTPVLGTPAPAGTIKPNTWHYVECQVKLHDTTGFVIVRVDGTVVVNATNVDTKQTSTKVVYDALRLEEPNTGTVFWMYDDFYLKTGAGETFLGDITIATLYPNGNGNANQWLGSDGNSTDNYLLVDEVPPAAVDHVKSSTAGQIDQYTLTDATLTGTIVGVCHQATMALGAAGSQTFQIVNRRTTDTVSPTLTSTSTTYAGFHYALTTDPETGAAWTIANINALQTGVKVV